jgi:hypothetical protein
MVKCKAWNEYLEYPDVEARCELYSERKELVDAKVIGYFIDVFGIAHEFVRWDNEHGQFHKHCLYEKKQRKEVIALPLARAIVGARHDLERNWLRYKRDYVKNHLSASR